jgi:hypothetical protein
MKRPARHAIWSRSSSATLRQAVTTLPANWRLRIRYGFEAIFRGGRTNEQKSQMLRRIMQGIGRASGVAEDTVWVYLCDIPAANVAEYRRVLLPPGQEDAWFSSLPDAMRERLRPSA